MKKTVFCIYHAKTKGQISCKVNAQLIRALYFAPWIVQSLFLLNFKPLSIFCGCTARFVTDLVRNPEDRFSPDVAQSISEL